MRKDAGLTIYDFIKLEYNTNEKQITKVFEDYLADLQKAVLAREIAKTENSLDKIKINDTEIGLKIEKI